MISDFSPDGGTWKTNVTISGSGFSGASSVRFNGKEAPFFVASDSTITARVPSGAGVGPIRVANAAGVDVSDTDFRFRRIRHRVVLKMHLEGHLEAIGRVTLPHAGARARFECGAGRLVTIQRKISGVFTSVGEGESEGGEGRFVVVLPDRRGEYRAIIEVSAPPTGSAFPTEASSGCTSTRRPKGSVPGGGKGKLATHADLHVKPAVQEPREG